MPDQLWREVVVSRMVSVQGGYGGAAQTVESKEVLYDGRVTSLRQGQQELPLVA